MNAERPAPSPQRSLLIRRWRDARTAVALAIVVLMLPSVLSLVDRGTVFGVPTVAVFVFAVWLCGIWVSRLFARRIADH